MTNTAINLKFFKQTDKMMDNMLTNTWWFVGMGACVWVCGWIQSAGLMTVANRVSNRMRIEFFRAILRQDIGYFDVHSSAEDSFQLTIIYVASPRLQSSISAPLPVASNFKLILIIQ